MPTQDPLISAEALAARLGAPTLRLIDCRASITDPAYGRSAYAEGHIPGAVHADLERDLSGPVVQGVTGRHPLPDAEALAGRLGDWGVDEDAFVVAYDDDTGAIAARAWWLLRWLGHEGVAVLDGGFAAWREAGHPVTREVRPPPPAVFRPRPALTRTREAAELLDSELTLVDARGEARYRGEEEPIDAVAGHIPGARCLPFAGNLCPNGRFRTKEALAARFADLEGREVVCYCGSGVSAAHNILAMRLAGLPEPALYPGSWSEWITDPSRPVSRPGRGAPGRS